MRFAVQYLRERSQEIEKKMSQSAKAVLTLVLVLIGVVLVYKVVTAVVGTLLGLLIPLAILGGIGYVVYALIWKNNALPGGRRFLP